jgi:hypothetical protein
MAGIMNRRGWLVRLKYIDLSSQQAEKELPLTEAHMEMTQEYPAGSLPGGTAEGLRDAIHAQISQ